MEKRDIIEKIAPCSLLCHTCSAYCNGAICTLSRELLGYLDGMEAFYEAHMPDAAETYRSFEQTLRRFGSGPCPGCRSGQHTGCSIAGCFLPECTREHGVDFCGECDAFPCEKVKDLFEERVYIQWLEGNRQIRADGVEAFWEASSAKPHYQAYKK